MDYSMLVGIKKNNIVINHTEGDSWNEEETKNEEESSNVSFSIIDYLQKYTFRKKLEFLFNGLNKKSSCVPPDYYCERFKAFLA